MDVVCLSSDSENSTVPNDIQMQFQSEAMNMDDDVFLVDWNDEFHPAVNYVSQPGNAEANDTKSNEDIDSFIASIQQKKEELNKNDQVNCKDQLTTAVYEISDNSSTEGEEKLSLDSDNSDKCSNFYKKSSTQKRVKNKQSQELKETIKILNKQKKLEKEHLKEEKKNMQQKQKVIKAATMENQRNLKPEENIKFLRVHIDNEILNSVSGSNIISFLQQNSIQYIVEPQIKSQTIAWSKRSVIKEVDDFGEVIDKIYCREEKELIYVIPWEKAVKLIYSNELLTHVETIKSAYINKNLTVIIYGLQKYFEFKKNKKTNESKNKNIKYTEIEKSFKEAPNITHDQVEFALTDLQLWGKHNCRLLEHPEELSGLVLNFTKSLSQLEYKLDKEKRKGDDLDWFAKGDSNQTVKVDKNGTGLINLWKQQICQFNAVGVETAQAIISQYNSPLALVNKYNQCNSSDESELLLQNIQIRRDLGLLSSTRRVGPQLSKKLYKFFTTDDPDVEL